MSIIINADNVIKELQEYVVVDGQFQGIGNAANAGLAEPPTSFSTPINTRDYKWGHNETKALINLYGKYRGKIGTFEIKTIQQMWQKIVEELAKLHILVTIKNCMNRWKVLERNYKKFVDNQSKTGRGRKFFEYQAEMEEIFGKKKNVYPELLLSTETINKIVGPAETKSVGSSERSPKSQESEVPTPTTPKRNFQARRKSEASIRKASAFEKTRLDRKKYYDEKIEIEKQKLEENRTRNRLITERNELIREQNQLLKEGCKCKHPNMN